MRRAGKRTVYTTAYVGEVDVDLDLAEVIEDMTDAELAEFGLCRTAPTGKAKGSQYEHDLCSPALAEHKWAVSHAHAKSTEQAS